jgi:hypothetical protein
MYGIEVTTNTQYAYFLPVLPMVEHRTGMALHLKQACGENWTSHCGDIINYLVVLMTAFNDEGL